MPEPTKDLKCQGCGGHMEFASFPVPGSREMAHGEACKRCGTRAVPINAPAGIWRWLAKDPSVIPQIQFASGSVTEMGAGGAGVMGSLMPLGGGPHVAKFRKKGRKESLDRVAESHPDVGFAGLAVMLGSLDGPGSDRVCEHLDAGRLSEVADIAREAIARRVARSKIEELVRKKKGGGWVLYAPKKGKGKEAKRGGEFTSQLAAKRAELSRFPPKDPKKLAKLKKQVDRLNKDPKARSNSKQDKGSSKKESAARLPDGSGAFVGTVGEQASLASKELLEARIIAHLVRGAIERNLAGGPLTEGKGWDDYVDKLSNKIIKGDSGLKRAQLAIARAADAAGRRAAEKKRDKYMDRLEKKIESLIAGLSPVGMDMLRDLLARKHRGG